ncbi:hypothetical protein [Micromonospora craniellae]|uniref:Uncharacterized protein n=1 Tax=Micromonospora craniellae TaxID=2294034 RepID=A0A372G2Q4_9ACTN|nr:hypothetical protein [Micromonospora craniellae]QOC89852.1 hypothetical protein ID554_16575 [Micromonospora craniellae]RFS47000.1 hypothetical protein D0Q02_07505 [Micromonospora craniellae]
MSRPTLDPAVTTPRPTVPAPSSLMSAIRTRMAGAGWHHQRDAAMGRETWTEPTLPAGQREPRSIVVDEVFAAAGGRVIEACNGHERLMLRCVGDTDPAMVLVTLDVWRMLPNLAATPTAREAVATNG